MSTLAGELHAFAKKIEQLEDRILQLEDLLGMGEDDMALIRSAIPSLTAREARLLGLLRARRGVVSFENIMDAVYGDRGEMPATKVYTVTVSTLRHKIAELGLTITTVNGLGYSMSEDSRKRLTKMMERALPAPAARVSHAHGYETVLAS